LGTVYLVMSHLPRRYQSSRTDWMLTYFAAATIYSDYGRDFPEKNMVNIIKIHHY